MPYGFRSYFMAQEEVGTVGVPELSCWGGQKGTKWDAAMYFDSETMAEANELRFLTELGHTTNMDAAIKKSRLYGKKCEGSVTFTVYPESGGDKGLVGMILKHVLCDYAHGTYTGAGTYVHSYLGRDEWIEHLLPAAVGTGTGVAGLTIHVGREDSLGSLRDYPFIGCRIRSVTFSCAANEELKCTVDFVGRLAQDDTTSLSPSYPTMEPFRFHDATFEIGADENGASGTERTIEAFSVTINNNLAESFVLGTQTLGRVRLGAHRTVTGSYRAPFYSWVRDEQQKWKDNTTSSCRIQFASSSYVLEFRLPDIRYTGNPPSISDPGENVIELPFQGIYKSGAYDVKAFLVNTDEVAGTIRS